MTQGQAGFFIDRADANGVLLAASIALPEEPGIALAGLAILHLVNIGASAMNAVRFIAPTLLFKEFDGGGFVAAGQWNFANHFRCINLCSLILLMPAL